MRCKPSCRTVCDASHGVVGLGSRPSGDKQSYAHGQLAVESKGAAISGDGPIGDWHRVIRE